MCMSILSLLATLCRMTAWYILLIDRCLFIYAHLFVINSHYIYLRLKAVQILLQTSVNLLVVIYQHAVLQAKKYQQCSRMIHKNLFLLMLQP